MRRDKAALSVGASPRPANRSSLDVSARAMQETVRPMFPKGAHMTEEPSEAYLAGYFFGRGRRRTERRFDAVSTGTIGSTSKIRKSRTLARPSTLIEPAYASVSSWVKTQSA